MNRFCFRIISLHIFLFVFGNSFAQDRLPGIDSLYQALEKTNSPEEKLETMKKLMMKLESVDIAEGLKVYKEAIELLPQIKDPKEQFYITEMTINYCMAYQIDLPYARSLIPKAKEMATTYYEDKENLASLMISEASFYLMEGNLEAYVEITKEILEIANSEDNKLVEGVTLFNLAYVYSQYYNYEEALFYARKALVQIKKIRPITRNSKDHEARIHQFIGLNLQYAEPEKVDSSLFFSKKGYAIWDSLSMIPLQKAQAAFYLGNAYLKARDYTNAQKYLYEGIDASRSVGMQEGIVLSGISLARIFSDLGEKDSLKKYIKLIDQPFSGFQISGMQEFELISLKASLMYWEGDFSNAYITLIRGGLKKDSVNSEERQALLSSNLVKFQVAEKEKELAQQELAASQARNSRNQILLIGGTLIMILAVLFQWRINHQSKQRQKAKLAQQMAQAESNRLKELDQLKNDFFTNISHELRTPLTLILSPVSDALEQVQSRVMRDKLETIQQNGERLLNLVNEIMDLSKVEAGKMELHLSVMNLGEFLKRVFYSFESLAQLRRISYKANIDISEVFVEGDRDKLEKILNNLLSNAIKFSPAGGKVSLLASRMNGNFSIRIEDSGQGIDVEDQEKVFDRFYQSKNVNGSLQGGTGVGLALSKELAELMDGSIQLESEIGVGSSFTLSLPLKEVQQPDQIALEEEYESSSQTLAFAPIMINGKKPRLLIVEDNPALGKYLIQLLNEDYQCILAQDGMEALKQLKINHFDLILSDVMMPNMDGFELRRKINERRDWKIIPFVLLTARHLEEDRITGFQLGIDDYLTKPFSKLELQARIHNLIHNKLERDEFKHSNEAKGNVSNVDQEMLRKMEHVVLEHMTDPQFGVESLASEINYSSKQARRILKELTGMTTVNFILEVRLQKARELLERRQVASVTEAQVAVGIDSASYFTRKFTERFGINPKNVGRL
ncbi:MAG: ATP-binding protein [Bacteroidia bacterium]|nr:ATP-binding protein [Bacteroidia bacterium]